MIFSDRGIPILKMDGKLDALAAMIRGESWEDAAGHLCDLLEHCRVRAIGSDGRMYATLKDFVAYYGSHPTRIDTED